MTSMTSTGNSEGKAVIVRNGPATAAPGRLLRRARIAAASVSGAVAVICASLLVIAPSASALPAAPKLPAVSYATISGAGSTWAQNAINQWVSDVAQNGLTVNYSGVGSTTGRAEFRQGTVEFGASEIPYAVSDMNGISDTAPTRGYAYMPDVAGGTVFMYNLKIGPNRVTDLRLSGSTIADIFTGRITYWDDPEIKKDNPDLTLPHIQIVPVVRSDGSGATADFTQWMLATDPSAWHYYCTQINVPQSNCIQTSTYPVDPHDPAMIAQANDNGVAGYVAQNSSNGAIGYTQYSFAIRSNFPVAKVLNADGYYTEPTPQNVAVSLLAAQINLDQGSPLYLTQNLTNVYTDPDPRTYELSAYSYFILPTDKSFNLTAPQGNSLGAFGSYLLCQGQQQVDDIGYSALPINLVIAGYQQLAKIPGATVQNTSQSFVQGCNNPTFDGSDSPGHNKLAETAPYPASCDKEGSVQCTTPTGGAPGSGGAGGTTGSTSGGTSGTGGTGGSTGTTGTTGNSGTSGTGGTSDTGGTTSTGGTTGTDGTTGSGGTSGSGTATCDPNTGICGTGSTGSTGSGGTSAESGNPIPITLSSSNGNGVQLVLMALSSALLLGLCIVPPLAAAASGNRRQRRVERWSSQGGQGNGGQGDGL
jgi:phosphate ABC transporter phosphate-binding protein